MQLRSTKPTINSEDMTDRFEGLLGLFLLPQEEVESGAEHILLRYKC